MTGLIVPRLSLGVACSSQSLIKSSMPRWVVGHSGGGVQVVSDEYVDVASKRLVASSIRASAASVEVGVVDERERSDAILGRRGVADVIGVPGLPLVHRRSS